MSGRRFALSLYHTKAKMAPSTIMPPTAPPAIAPALVDLGVGAGVDGTGLGEGTVLVVVVVVLARVIALVGTEILKRLVSNS